MASLRQLNDKIKTFNDFKKVVNIQKVVVMKEIAEWKKVVNQAKFRNNIFNNLILDIQKKFHIYDSAFFSNDKNSVPVDRDLHFLIGPKGMGGFTDYANKLILEFIKKNHKPEDVYVVIGTELAKLLNKEEINILHVMDHKKTDDIALFKRISFQVLRAFKDLMFKHTDLLFLNSGTKQVEHYPIFPFNKKKVDLSKGEFKTDNETLNIINGIKLTTVEWQKDLSAVSEHMLSLAIEMKTYSIMVEHKLSAKLRELQSLEDKEKNINEEIASIVLMAQRVRKENVTNELLTNATAFAALSEEEEEE